MPPAPVPADVDEFFRRPNPAVVASLRRDGSPHTVATWYDWEENRVLLNMDESRLRLRFMRRDPRMALTVLDEEGWHHHVSLLGRISTLEEDLELRDIDRLALRYTGEPFRPAIVAASAPGWSSSAGTGGMARTRCQRAPSSQVQPGAEHLPPRGRRRQRPVGSRKDESRRAADSIRRHADARGWSDYEPLPTLMIGQLSLIEVARSVSPPFFSSWSICVSLLIRTGVALAFQLRIVSFQTASSLLAGLGAEDGELSSGCLALNEVDLRRRRQAAPT